MFLQDTLTNLIAGIGAGTRDKVQGGAFVSRVLTRPELLALYREDWVAGRAIDAPAEDQTRAWRRWQAGPRQITAIEATEKRLQIREKVQRALKLSGVFGGCAMVLGDGAADPSKPLAIEGIGRGDLRYVHVFTDEQITPGPTEMDLESEYFGQPGSWRLNLPNKGSIDLHPSRVIEFLGQECLDRQDGKWRGDSRLQRIYDAVLNAATGSAALAALMVEAKVDVIKVEGLTANVLDPVYRSRILQRFMLANTGKSINNALLLDATEEWEQKTATVTGWPEVLTKFLEIAAGASEMPVSRLLGKAPTGLNSNTDGDTRAYYDRISNQQDTRLRPQLERLDEALIRSAIGSRPAAIHYEWASLWQMTEAEKSTIGYQKAQAMAIYGSGAFMPPTALRQGVQNMLIEDALLPGLEAAIEKAGAEQPAPLIQKAAPAAPSSAGKASTTPSQ